MPDVFRYQSLCRVNGKFDTEELNKQALLFGIEPNHKSRRYLCKEIAKAVESFLAKSGGQICKNGDDTDVIGERYIKDLPSYLRWNRVTPKGEVYCFSLVDMKKFIDNKVKTDPIGYTITESDRADIEEKYGMISSILTPFGLTMQTPIHPLAVRWMDSVRSNVCFAKYIKDVTKRDRLTHQLMLRFLVALTGIYGIQLIKGEYENRTKVMKTICNFTDGLPQPIVRYFFTLMGGAPLNMNIRTIWNLLLDDIRMRPLWSQPMSLHLYPPFIENLEVRALVDDEKYEEDLLYVQEHATERDAAIMLPQHLMMLLQNIIQGQQSATNDTTVELPIAAPSAVEVPQRPRAMRVRNPLTNRCIDIGGETYRRLVRQNGQRAVDLYTPCP